MSLNIKNERTHALVRELAERTGQSQTSAVEDAVARRLEQLEGETRRSVDVQRREVGRILVELRHGWSDDDVAALRAAEQGLYDEHGLPR